MRKLERYLGIVLLVLLTGMVCSCGKERTIERNQGKAVVDLTFYTRNTSDNQDESTAPLEDNENFKTIRVIVTNQNNDILANIYDNNLPEGGVSEYTLRIVGLPADEMLNFYVIGNEASVGKDFSDWSSGLTLLDTEIIDSEKKYFPKMRSQISSLGLPITGVMQVQSLQDGVNTLNIGCTHSVVKVVLNVNNLMNESFWVTQANFGKFITDGTYLFAQESLGLPEHVTSNSYSFSSTNDTGLEIKTGENNAVFVFYIYETGLIPYENYSLSLTSATVPELEEKKYIFGESAGKKFLTRNQQLNINATIDIQKEVSVKITYNVKDWTTASIEIPSFN